MYNHLRRRKWRRPTPCSYMENPGDRGAWWAAVFGSRVGKRLKWFSNSSSITTWTLASLEAAGPGKITCAVLRVWSWKQTHAEVTWQQQPYIGLSCSLITHQVGPDPWSEHWQSLGFQLQAEGGSLCTSPVSFLKLCRFWEFPLLAQIRVQPCSSGLLGALRTSLPRKSCVLVRVKWPAICVIQLLGFFWILFLPTDSRLMSWVWGNQTEVMSPALPLTRCILDNFLWLLPHRMGVDKVQCSHGALFCKDIHLFYFVTHSEASFHHKLTQFSLSNTKRWLSFKKASK